MESNELVGLKKNTGATILADAEACYRHKTHLYRLDQVTFPCQIKETWTLQLRKSLPP